MIVNPQPVCKRLKCRDTQTICSRFPLLMVKLKIGKLDELVVLCHQFFGDVAIFVLRRLIQAAAIVVTDQIDFLTCPPTGIMNGRRIQDIATTAVITFAQQIGEDGSLWTCAPLP